MRVGIDAHIILPIHKRYDPQIARFTEELITQLIDRDMKKEHTWVLFFDQRMKGSHILKKFKRDNVVIRHFPFVQYRQYLPVLYSHMLISGFLRAARLDVFHSPEGLIPFIYPGRIITTFHYVPRGKMDSNLFARTFMLGARVAFAQLCKRAKRIIVFSRSDKKLLSDRHSYPEDRIVVFETPDRERVDWAKQIKELMSLYKTVGSRSPQKIKKLSKKSSRWHRAPKKSKKKANK